MRQVEQVMTLCRLNGIECRIGGSTLLQHHGLVDEANDLDCFVEPDQFEKLDRVLARVGDKRDVTADPSYVTTYFAEYVVEGQDVDVMAGFRMKCTDGVYTHPYILPDGNWMHLEEWIVLYTVIGRSEKVEALVRHFTEHPLNRSIVETCLKRAPVSVVEQVMARFGDLMKR